MKDYVIGLDIGTGSVKALAIDREGTVISSAQQTYPLIQSDEDTCEQDPEQIWQAVVACIRSIRRELQQDPQAISLSSAMHSLILIDVRNQLMGNMITWADNRAGKVAERIQRSATAEMLYEQTGAPIHAMTPFCKIVWLKEQNPGLYGKVSKYISIKEFIWFKLFGEYEVDYSIAGASGLFDIERCKWNENALSIAGIRSEQLSALVNSNWTRKKILSAVAAQLEISLETLCVIGSSDGCLANLGSFATSPGIAALTIGTSGAVRVASEKPVFNFSAMTFNYRLDDKTFICGGPTNNGGVVLKWYAENFLKKKLVTSDDYHSLLADVQTIPAGCDGLTFLPYLLGERAPIWNSDATGVFYGIKSSHTQAHFTRAVLEGVALALYNIGENMEKGGLGIQQLNVSGGFVHSTEWLKIISDLFGKKLYILNTGDASALGAGYLALKTLGMIGNYDQLKPRAQNSISPDLGIRDVYMKKYQLFTQLYKRLEPVMDSQ